MPRASVIAALLLCLLPGCLGAAESEIAVIPYVGEAQAAPGRTATFALFVRNAGEFRADAGVSFADVPGGWTVTADALSLSIPGGGVATVLVNATPGPDARYGLARFTAKVGDGAADLHVRVADGDATEARPGIGARVHTVGLWDNGTIFYHNWRDIRDNAALPKAELGGAATSFDPLKVYVGGRRGERPPEPYNRTGYFPVIQGFDHALRGMRAGETHAVRIPPEMAYTLPKNEEHPLYGDALTFVIHVVSVDALQPEEPTGPGGVPCPPPVC